MSRFLGLWKPRCFARNKFQLFYTIDPKVHRKLISKDSSAESMSCQLGQGPEIVIYSSKSYPNYLDLYTKYLSYLGSAGHKITDNSPKYSHVEFKDNNVPDIDADLENLKNTHK
jgi:hypothetical protein